MCDGVSVDIGAEIRQARESAGLTQGQAAERYGCAQPTWSGWETNRSAMTTHTLNAIARALGCELRVRLVRTNEKRPAG